MNISQAATVTGGWPQWGRGLLGIIWQEQDECVEMILCVKIVEWRSDVWGGQGQYTGTATLSPHISSRSKKINGITLIGKRNLYKTASIDNLETSISEDRKQIFENQWVSTFCPASFKDKTKWKSVFGSIETFLVNGERNFILSCSMLKCSVKSINYLFAKNLIEKP